MAGYPQARSRYQAGLPKKGVLFVYARLRERSDKIRLGEIKVSKIDSTAAEASGQIVNEIKDSADYAKGQEITIPESQLLDWKIRYADGTEEGNAFAKYLASLGHKADISALLVDQRDIDIRALEKSPQLLNALDQTVRAFFDDPQLKIERITHDSQIEDWPTLCEHYHGLSAKEIVADLQSKAEAGKTVRKVTVEDKTSGREPIINVTFYVVLKHGERIFEVRQFLHFELKNEATLRSVGWGLRRIRIIKPKGN